MSRLTDSTLVLDRLCVNDHVTLPGFAPASSVTVVVSHPCLAVSDRVDSDRCCRPGDERRALVKRGCRPQKPRARWPEAATAAPLYTDLPVRTCAGCLKSTWVGRDRRPVWPGGRRALQSMIYTPEAATTSDPWSLDRASANLPAGTPGVGFAPVGPSGPTRPSDIWSAWPTTGDGPGRISFKRAIPMATSLALSAERSGRGGRDREGRRVLDAEPAL